MGRLERFNRAAQQLRTSENIATNRAVFDRFGRPIVEGATVVFRPEIDIAFQVKSITPDLSPQAPAGACRITLLAEFPLLALTGRPLPNFIVGQYPEAFLAQGLANGGGHDLADQGQSAGTVADVANPETPPAAPGDDPGGEVPPAGGTGIVLTDLPESTKKPS